eukprot:GHVP01049605.1.p1 GENE.GHVP01049605.1~~GHVP01049605.1.p1  ORF type:complete len:225 (+),score=32.63 GHVP01049605.1:1354-2028(+)
MVSECSQIELLPGNSAVRTLADFKVSFNPLFTHHFFDTVEPLEDWDLESKIQIFVSPASFRIYPRITGRISMGKNSQKAAEEELEKLFANNPYPDSKLISERALIKDCQLAGHEMPPGNVSLSFKNPDGRNFEIRKSKFGEERFEKLHRRVEWFLHFFIENANNITYSDDWEIFILYEVKGSEETPKKKQIRENQRSCEYLFKNKIYQNVNISYQNKFKYLLPN